MSEPLVTLAEVGVVVGRKAEVVEAEARDLGMLVVENWKSEPSLSAAEAKSLADGSARAVRDHERAWAAHVAAERAWFEGRAAVTVEAAEKVRAAQRGPVDGEAWSKANAAAQRAADKYEQTHKRPSFPGVAAHKRAWP